MKEFNSVNCWAERTMGRRVTLHFPSVSLRFSHSRWHTQYLYNVKQHEQQEHGSPAGQGSCKLLVLGQLVKLRIWGGGGSGYQKQHVAPHWVFEWLCKQRLKGKHPHMKCICSHYSGVSAAANTRGLTLAFAGGMCMCSYILSLNPDTKGLFEQINRLIAWYLTLSSPASTWTHEADWMIDSQIAADLLHSQRQKKKKKKNSRQKTAIYC